MKRPVLWSEAAIDHLDEQIKYIARDNPSAAISTKDRVEQAARNLGERSIGRPGRERGTFEKLVAGLPYVIFYGHERRDGQDVLIIYRIRHTSRDRPGSI